MIRKLLKITLKSALCSGSGYSYAGVIDSDTCYDELGLPYIPARRLKGCLRDVAFLLEEKTDYFGETGQGFDTVTPISIFDAKIENYDEIAPALRSELSARHITVEDVLAQYTRVVAQTSVDDNGVADDNSLRFTRVVNRFDPLKIDRTKKTGQELVFLAPVEIECESEEKENDVASFLSKITKGLRHMGLNRNRGFGNVRCELINCEGREQLNITDNVTGKPTKDEKVELRYTIVTESPLMISKNSNAESENYINGQSVLGFFATRYLRYRKVDEEFNRLFLKNEVIFSPLYPSSEDGKKIFYPAPLYICRLKKTKRFVNTTQWPDDKKYHFPDPDYNPSNGNQPKKLKGKFLSFIGDKVELTEVSKEIIYHNRRQNEKNNKESNNEENNDKKNVVKQQLYSAEAISAGQYFSGTIRGSFQDVKIMAEILKEGRMSFGKSRHAQYGKCRVISAEIRKLEAHCQDFVKGDSVLVTFLSDAIFMDDYGYTVDTEKVRDAVKSALGIEELEEKDTSPHPKAEEDDKSPYTEIDVKELTGYYGKWNLKRQAIPAVAAGTTFEFCLSNKPFLPTGLGEKIGEGFGIFSIRKNTKDWEIKANENDETNISTQKVSTDVIRPILSAIEISDLKAEILKYVNQNVTKTRLTASAVGRLTLMLAESKFGTNSKVALTNLDKKIADWKDEDKRKDAEKFKEKYTHSDDIEEILSKSKYIGSEDKDDLRLYSLEQALVLLKYNKKSEDENNG